MTWSWMRLSMEVAIVVQDRAKAIQQEEEAKVVSELPSRMQNQRQPGVRV